MSNERDSIKVTWSDCKKYNSLVHITYRKMHEKFYPHFCSREEEVKQEMLVELIKVIRRIKNGEVRVNERNMVITALKYKCYALARKYIDEDRNTRYLEDIKLSGMGYEITWEDLFPSDYVSDMNLFCNFKTFEEKYMVMILLSYKGYTRRKLRDTIRKDWKYMAALEDRVKKKIKENIKRRVSNG